MQNQNCPSSSEMEAAKYDANLRRVIAQQDEDIREEMQRIADDRSDIDSERMRRTLAGNGKPN